MFSSHITSQPSKAGRHSFSAPIPLACCTLCSLCLRHSPENSLCRPPYPFSWVPCVSIERAMLSAPSKIHAYCIQVTWEATWVMLAHRPQQTRTASCSWCCLVMGTSAELPHCENGADAHRGVQSQRGLWQALTIVSIKCVHQPLPPCPVMCHTIEHEPRSRLSITGLKFLAPCLVHSWANTHMLNAWRNQYISGILGAFELHWGRKALNFLSLM